MKRYRKFNIKIQKNEQDDYGMMREVCSRAATLKYLVAAND